MPLAIVAGFHVPVSQTRGRDRPKPFSTTRSAGFKLSASFFICSFEIAFYVDDASYFSVFLRPFTKSSKTLFASVKAGSEIMKNGFLCGGERRKRSMTARIDFVDKVHGTFFLADLRPDKHSFLLLTFPLSVSKRGHRVVFLGKTLYSYSASLHPGI